MLVAVAQQADTLSSHSVVRMGGLWNIKAPVNSYMSQQYEHNTLNHTYKACNDYIEFIHEFHHTNIYI